MSAGAAPRAQAGIVAVEFALVLVLMFVMLAMTLAAARLFWHYTVLQKAGNDALRYLTSVPAIEIMDTATSQAAMATARAMVDSAVAAAKLDTAPGLIDIVCQPNPCGTAGGRPATIQLRMYVPLEPYLLSGFLPQEADHPVLSISSTAPYAN